MWMGVTYDEHASGIRLEQHEYIGENVCVTTRTSDTGLRFQYWNCWVGGNWKRFKFKKGSTNLTQYIATHTHTHVSCNRQ